MSKEREGVFIDIQGFPLASGFIPKELAVYDGVRFCSFLFKPPYSKKLLKEADMKIVEHLENTYHGLFWKSGSIDLTQFEDILCNIRSLYNNPKFMVKGDLKANCLKQFFDSSLIFQIPLKIEPKLSKYKEMVECFNHKDFKLWHCACNNVKLLYNFRHCILQDME